MCGIECYAEQKNYINYLPCRSLSSWFYLSAVHARETFGIRGILFTRIHTPTQKHIKMQRSVRDFFPVVCCRFCCRCRRSLAVSIQRLSVRNTGCYLQLRRASTDFYLNHPPLKHRRTTMNFLPRQFFSPAVAQTTECRRKEKKKNHSQYDFAFDGIARINWTQGKYLILIPSSWLRRTLF